MILGRLLNRSLHQSFDVSLKMIRRNYTPRRALLYVPGHDPKKIKKALQLKVDALIFDMEDGVAVSKKEAARESIRNLLEERPFSTVNPEWIIRINPVGLPEMCEGDIDAVLSAKHLPPTIALPKVESGDELCWFSEKVWNRLIQRNEGDRGPINLIMFIESARAIMILPEICQKAENLATMAPIIPVALVFGGDDLIADLGATKSRSAVELLYARQRLVLIAKAFGLQAVDMVETNFRDEDNLLERTLDGAKMGFTGKQIIHPLQVTHVQDAFTPSRAEVDRARALVKAFEENQKAGQGAFVFRDQMVDMPLLKQAQNVLKLVQIDGNENS